MKRFDKICVIVFLLVFSLIAIVNFWGWQKQKEEIRTYRIEANRITQELRQKELSEIDLSKYSSIVRVVSMEETQLESFMEGSDEDYLIRNVSGKYYRIDYNVPHSTMEETILLVANIILVCMAAIVFAVLFFVRQKIIRPYIVISNLPCELSKGNLTVPLKEQKGRYFGKFIWGLNLLREKLEERKKHELELEKEKKTLILSISHDIKTPLSAIKLYAKALSKGLYTEPERQIDAANSINENADRIEAFISQIIEASRGDFLNLEVENSEYYLSDLMQKIQMFYQEKMSLNKTEFVMEEYSNCLLKGDLDRSIEVLQNVLENAVKYGDGQRVTVSVSEEERCKLVTVRNSGCSLKEDELAHIFESFWRGSNVKGKDGSGLGLYICQQLMRKMGGEIYAEIQGNEMCVTAVFCMT